VCSVIAGATTAEQVQANGAAGRTVLTPDTLAAIDALFS
jgi:aryl-alcohol dehydrogenase-like predicted oxidoreductase